MKKKISLMLVILISIVFSFSMCFANDMTNDASKAMENTMNDAENTIGGAVNSIGNTLNDSMHKTENTMNNVGNTMEQAGNTVKDSMNNMTTDNNYTATRTTTEGEATFMGMNSMAWTWLIIGLAAIGIISAVWYYAMQVSAENNNRKRD